MVCFQLAQFFWLWLPSSFLTFCWSLSILGLPCFLGSFSCLIILGLPRGLVSFGDLWLFCLPLCFGSSIGCYTIKVLSMMFGIIYNSFFLYIVNVLSYLLSCSCHNYQPLCSVNDIPVDMQKYSNDFISYFNMICLLKRWFIFHYLFIKFLSAPFLIKISEPHLGVILDDFQNRFYY